MTLQLFYGRIGRESALCNGCGRRIEPQTMIVQRSDGLLFHSEDCARAFSVPSLDTISPDAPT
jgi:hypothetical protein